MNDIIRKLSSRKLWIAVGTLLGVFLAPGISDTVQAIAAAVIAAGYAIGEGIADSKG
jgi:hypothetical protein